MITETVTVADFVRLHGITLKSSIALFRPDRDENSKGNEWDRTAKHYACELSRTGSDKTVRFHYSQGKAIKRRPQAADTLDSLKSDASNAGGDFESWADDYGYDTDSRRAYATWEACGKIRRDLIAFLGHALYRELEAAEGL